MTNSSTYSLSHLQSLNFLTNIPQFFYKFQRELTILNNFRNFFTFFLPHFHFIATAISGKRAFPAVNVLCRAALVTHPYVCVKSNIHEHARSFQCVVHYQCIKREKQREKDRKREGDREIEWERNDGFPDLCGLYMRWVKHRPNSSIQSRVQSISAGFNELDCDCPSSICNRCNFNHFL